MSGHVRVVVVMGVSGSGKTTLARALADAWPATFLDADDIHSLAAKTRMAGGQPLTDRMRAPWVRRIALDLQRRVAGILPVRMEVPRGGRSYRFVRPLVLDEETKITFQYKSK